MILTTRKQVFQYLRGRGCNVWYSWEIARRIGKPAFGPKGTVHTFRTYE